MAYAVRFFRAGGTNRPCYTFSMERINILAGTYTDSGSEGIYSFGFEDGKLTSPELFAKISSPKYISVENGLVASIGKFEHGAGAAVFDRNGTMLGKAEYEKKTSCFITWHDGDVYTANYHEGTFTKLKFDGSSLRVEKTVEIKEGAGCHQVLFHDNQILVPALFLDRLMIFDTDLNYQGSVVFPDGTGPRHGIFSKDQSTLYLLSELSNELFVLEAGTWKLRASMPVLKDGRTHLRGGAAIRLSEDETRLYVSTRGQDLISVIDLERMTVLQDAYCGGKHPRDFILAKDAVLCANRYSDTVVCFRRNNDGTIGEETSRINIPQAVSLAVIE